MDQFSNSQSSSSLSENAKKMIKQQEHDDLMYSIFGSISSSSSVENINQENVKENVKEISEIPDVKEALNEYFKLKRNYENKIMDNKKKIINNPTLSKREKRSEFLKLKPKCINCQRPGGTRFNITYFSETDKSEAYRQYTALCGIISDPCNLDIKIQVGKFELLPDLLNVIQKEITDAKNEVIDNKNKLLFGYLNTNDVLEKFEDLKETISHYSSLYEIYLEHYNDIVDNEKKNRELEESITNSYIQIQQIKNCIKKMNETNNVQYAHDAVNIYKTVLQPLFIKIRNLKYNETMVWHDDGSNTCNLIQNKHSISNLTYTSLQNKVVSYNVGLKAQTKKKPGLIVVSDESTESIKIAAPGKESKIVMEEKEIPPDEPKYVDGGIEWNNPEYQKLWNKMPIKLKNVLMTNHDWMKEFLFNYINTKDKSYGYKFTAPKELKIPPTELSNDEYDFGVKIYNDEFKKLGPSLQKTYLTFNSLKDGVKNWNMLKDSMNDLVAKAVGFNKGYF
jgi:hypothetical protein